MSKEYHKQFEDKDRHSTCVFMAAIFYHVLEKAQEEGILQFRLTYQWIVSG